MSKPMNVWQRLIHYFLPTRLEESEGLEKRRAELTIMTVLMLFGWGPVFTLVYYFALGSTVGAAITGAATVTSGLALFLMRWTGKPIIAGNVYNVSLTITFVGLTVITGGLEAPGLWWVTILPLFALLFTGFRSGVAWLVISLLIVAVIYTLEVMGVEFYNPASTGQYQFLTLVGLLGLTAAVFTIFVVKDRLQQWLVDKLREREAKTNTILQTAPDGVVTIDEAGEIQTANRAAAEIFGHDDGELDGLSVGDLIPGLLDALPGPGESANLQHLWSSDALQGRCSVRGRFPVEVSVSPYEDGADGAVLIVRDITERKEAETQLKRARDEALEASRAKSAFLANMSHELRTPLNAVIGYSELIMEDIDFAREQADDQEEAPGEQFIPDLKRIRTAGDHLLELINDVLDLSKIEAGKMETHIETFELGTMLQDIGSTVEPLAGNNDNRFILTAPDEPGEMRTDITKVRQVLFNLLSNACKFTEEGEIELSVTRQPDALGGQEVVCFEVADTGIGMTDEQIDEIFGAFAQADDSTTREYGGTGLGLTIVRHFIDMLGGEFDVSSEPGEGTTFTVRLPANLTDAEAPAKASTTGAPSQTTVYEGGSSEEGDVILVIDDDEDIRELLCRVLEREGFEVATAASGAEGLELAAQIEPAAITLDVMMPQMDGWTVLSKLKEREALADIPVILLTMVSDRSRGMSLGADHYLIKPLDRQKLVDLMEDYRGEGTGEEILVVEDDSATREMIVRTLADDGWEVHQATDGQKALEVVDQTTPSLVLLDLMMPEMDGFEFLSELRGSEEYPELPVVVVTAKDLTDQDRQRLEDGVIDIVQKAGRDPKTLTTEVREQIERVLGAGG